MADQDQNQNPTPQNPRDLLRDGMQRRIQEKFGLEGAEIEPLLDDALEEVAGGMEAAEEEAWCSLWDCSTSGSEGGG